MNPSPDWRDVFCGRNVELKQLISAYDAVASGSGPRLAVVTAERGMGKTRLVQELYRYLSTNCDPADYWPDASLFKGNNLRVAPDFNDAHTKAHFASFKTSERPMPFLWWGFRLNDPLDRNAVRSDMAGHRRTLDPHLARALFARLNATRLAAVKGSALGTIKGAALAVGELLLDGVPGVGAIKTAVELAIGVSDTAKVRKGVRHEASTFAEADLAGIEAQRSEDIYERTLDDLALVLGASTELTKVPTVVFCDDAQFARDGDDEGALRFLDKVWQRAEEGQWPLLLVATHWEVDWEQDRQGENASFANTFRNIADNAEQSTIIRLPQQSDLGVLIAKGLPDLPPEDVNLLLGKSDGNPQVLIELVGLIQTSPAWRMHGKLTQYARKKIKALSCNLTTLITNRLNSAATPDDVKVAVALSSLQGMQFLSTLTEAAAEALILGATSSGLNKAANPLRLIVGLDAGVASFVQRAYREAAESLVESQLGDPDQIKAGVLRAAIAIIDDPECWTLLDADKQRAMLGVMASLAEDSPDDAKRHRAGDALVRLVELATDNAQRASHARQFAAGLGSKWPADAFTLSQLSCVRSALGVWYGTRTTVEVSEAMLELARARQADSVYGQTDLQTALRRAWITHNDIGDHQKAYVLCEEWVELLQRKAESDPTPENIEAICDALVDLFSISRNLPDIYTVGEGMALWRKIVSMRREQWERCRSAGTIDALSRGLYGWSIYAPPEETAVRKEIIELRRMIIATESDDQAGGAHLDLAGAIDALCSDLERLSSSVLTTEAVDVRKEVVEWRRMIATEVDDQAGEAHLNLARALERLADLLQETGQHAASAEARSERLTVLRDAWERLPNAEVVADELAWISYRAAEQECVEPPDQRRLLLEAVELVEAAVGLAKANSGRWHELPNSMKYYVDHYDARHSLRYRLQESLARNAASSSQWDFAREHYLQAAQFEGNDTHSDFTGLSQEIQSQLPSGVNWPSIDDLIAAKVAGLQKPDPVLDSLRQQFRTAPDYEFIRLFLLILSDRLDDFIEARLFDDAANLVSECYHVEHWSERCHDPEQERRNSHDYYRTKDFVQRLCQELRIANLFDKAIEFAIKFVELFRTGVVRGQEEERNLADALACASEIAEASGQRLLAVKFADESLDITRRIVKHDRESNLFRQLLKPLDWRAKLARRDADWETHDTLQRELLLTESENSSNLDHDWRTSGLICIPSSLIQRLADSVVQLKLIDPQASDLLKVELAETARLLLTSPFNRAETIETLAARLDDAGLDEEARLFEGDALAIRERELDSEAPAP